MSRNPAMLSRRPIRFPAGGLLGLLLWGICLVGPGPAAALPARATAAASPASARSVTDVIVVPGSASRVRASSVSTGRRDAPGAGGET